LLKNELVRLSAMSLVNPLTKEEAQRLKELINKEKLSLQEADELRSIARKLVSMVVRYLKCGSCLYMHQ